MDCFLKTVHCTEVAQCVVHCTGGAQCVDSSLSPCVAVVQSLKKTLSLKEEEKVAVDNLLAEALGDKRDLGTQLEKFEQIIAQLRDESLDKDVQIEALQRDFDEFSERYKKDLEGLQRERESVKG